MEDTLTIAGLRAAVAAGPVRAAVRGQIEAIVRKVTSSQKPYWDVTVVDAAGKLALKAWSDSPAFADCDGMRRGMFVEVEGEFAGHTQYGIEARGWRARQLDDAEREMLLSGSPERREKQRADFDFIHATVGTIGDPRLRSVCALFLEEHGERFRRAAAARTYHHARRGGLAEHCAQMMRAAVAIAGVYPGLNRDLLVAGALLHDCGKLWETPVPEGGFGIAHEEFGEMLGHITVGVELVNALWKRLPLEGWRDLEPASEDVRRHLLHLIASHHGSLEFGSPVDPKTPEAWALHHVDNLDAKLEMMACGYAQAAKLAPRIYERVRPLPGNFVEPLPPYLPSVDAPAEGVEA